MRSLGSYGSELIVENFRERFFHIWTIATYIRTYRSFRCMPPMSSFCEGILGFTGVWGPDHTITTLDAPPMAPRMDVATIGRSLSTWRFSLSLLSEVPTQFHLCHKKVQFYPEERGYTGGFNGRDNYYPRDDYWFGGYRYKLELSSFHHLLSFRAAAVSTSEDKIVAKNDESKDPEERKDKNYNNDQRT